MLPILVLLVASSAFAAPAIYNQGPNGISNSQNSFISRVFNSVKNGDIVINTIEFGAVIRDISGLGGNQALANGQALVLLEDSLLGRPGDSCAQANYINAYTRYVESGNPNGVRDALGSYVQAISRSIDNLVAGLTNAEKPIFTVGVQGGCPGEGRTYNFDGAWDIILGSASPKQKSLIDEEYCIVKRLYCAFDAVNNNVGASMTAAALPPSVQLFDLARGPLAQFLSNVASRSNLGPSAGNLKQALAAAVGKVSF